MAGQRDPEVGSVGVGVPAPEGVVLSFCLISMVCRDPGTGGGGGGGYGIEGGDWGPQAQPSRLLLSQMRTVTRVSIRKAPCKRALSPALAAPRSPAALHHRPDHRKGSRRKLSLHG